MPLESLGDVAWQISFRIGIRFCLAGLLYEGYVSPGRFSILSVQQGSWVTWLLVTPGISPHRCRSFKAPSLSLHWLSLLKAKISNRE